MISHSHILIKRSSDMKETKSNVRNVGGMSGYCQCLKVETFIYKIIFRQSYKNFLSLCCGFVSLFFSLFFILSATARE